MAENDQDNGNGQEEQDVRATRILTDIAPRAWEHPAHGFGHPPCFPQGAAEIVVQNGDVGLNADGFAI